MRRSFPSGQTTASKVKALVAYLDAKHGIAAGDALLAAITMSRDDIDDETHPVPLVTFHRALVAFTTSASKDEIAKTWPYLIGEDNLGVWMRAIRGTRKPEEAFSRIDGTDSEYGRTSRWETFTSRPGFWRGRVVLVHDPALEADGLLAQSRIAELSAVPALYGFGHARVHLTGERAETAVDAAQAYEVHWRIPDRRTMMASVGVATIAAALPAAIIHPSALTAIGAVVVGAAGALGGGWWSHGRDQRREAKAQAVRVQALERSLRLREQRDGDAGNMQGRIVAGQYKLAGRMGSGASGVIYEAARVGDGLPVAIKLLRAAAAHDAVASDRLRREAEALGLSWHPNVVELIDHGHLPDGTAYLVMELLRGEALATRIRTKVRMTPEEVLPIAIQVADALSAIHAAGVVHRDIKPSNVFLVPPRMIASIRPGAPTPAPASANAASQVPSQVPSSKPTDGYEDPSSLLEQAKVLDFGIARVEWEETRITNMGAPLGTPGYMSPEQEAGGVVDARSDVFALGALLYECLFGDPPSSDPTVRWQGAGASLAPSAISAESGAGPEALASGVRAVQAPPEWRALIDRALAIAPEDRYQDARSMAQALRALDPNAPPHYESKSSLEKSATTSFSD